MAIRSIILFVVLLSGCASVTVGFSDLTLGLSKFETMDKVGLPDTFQGAGEYEALTYNRRVNPESMTISDFHAIFKEGKLIKFGFGDLFVVTPLTNELSIKKSTQ